MQFLVRIRYTPNGLSGLKILKTIELARDEFFNCRNPFLR